MKELNVKKGTVVYEDPASGKDCRIAGHGRSCEMSVEGRLGLCAGQPLALIMKWRARTSSTACVLSGKICRAMGGTPPDGFSYELFLDEKGQKISKSIGNGITIDEWLSYASPQSLSLFMYQKPKTAKRLHFDIIPKNVDEYLTFLSKYPEQEGKDQLSNPVWHIHGGTPPQAELPISFALLLNLVSASNASEPDVLWGFIRRYAPDATPETYPLLDHLVGYAIGYYEHFVKPTKTYRAPSEQEAAALKDLEARAWGARCGRRMAATIQNVVYAVGKEHEFDPLRSWFSALYEVLPWSKPGPPFW